MNIERSRAGSFVLAALGCALALTLGWLLLAGDEAAPILERKTQEMEGAGTAQEAAILTSPEQLAAGAPIAAATQERIAVEEARTKNFVPVRGRVVSSESGQPLEKALISWLGANGQALGSSSSFEDGTFESPVPAEQVRRMRIAKEGFESLARTVESPEEYLELRLTAACELLVQLNVLGAAKWDKVEYQLWLPRVKSRKPGPVATKVGDETLTEVHFRGLAAGTYELTANVPGCGWAYRGNLTMRSGESLSVSLEIAPGVSLSGRVTLEEKQEPVSGAELLIRPKRQGIGRRLLADLTLPVVTDEDGYYGVEGLTPGEFIVLVQNSGLTYKELFDLPKSGATEVRNIVLPPVASLSGEVRDRSGSGLAGIQVVARVPRSKAKSERALPGHWETQTESDGRFQFQALPHGIELYVEASTDAESDDPAIKFFGESLKLKKGEQRADYLLVMHPPREVFGVVVGDDGEPIPGARLQVFAEQRGSQLASSDQADEAGQFRTRVFTPEPSLAVSAKGFLSRRVAIEPLAGAQHSPLRIELKHISLLTGTVLDRDGNGIPSARVEITRPKIPGESKRSRSGGRRSRTDEFGRFSAGGLAEGRWVVSAGNSGWIRGEASTVEVDLPTDDPVTLVLTRDPTMADQPASVRGAVRFKDGKIPTGVRFENLRGGAIVLDGDRFEITGVRPGRAVFKVTADASLSHRIEPIDLVSGGVYDLGVIDLDPATDLRVLVRGPNGEFVQGARVELRTTPAERQAGVKAERIRIGRDSRKERYRLKRTPRGEFQLMVRSEGFKPLRRIVRVGEESPQRIEVEMTAPN